MHHKLWQIVLFASLMVLLLSVVIVVAVEPGPRDATTPPVPAQNRRTPVLGRSEAALAYNTIVTVTSTADPDGKGSRVCYRDDIPTKVAMSPCTLRRALVEASALSDYEPSAEPILIKFNVPMSDAGYDSSLGVWTIELNPEPTASYALPRMDGNQITVDGDTQGEIGGRTDGPRVVVRGPAGNQNGMPIDGDQNTIRGLAFQTLKTYLYLNGDDNVVEDNWFGLADDGQDLHLRNELFPEDGSGYTGIDFAAGLSGARGNTVRNNVFAGFTGTAAALKGRENAFVGNSVGTVADGTVPLQGPFDQHPCEDGVWLGGSGITVADRDHRIGGPDEADGNLFAGLYLELFEASTQPPAVKVNSGQGHLIQNNVIGRDAAENVVGVCGRGLDFTSGPAAMQVISNTILQPNLSAIVMNHWTLNGNTLRGNVIRREGAWPAEQGDNTFPEDAIAYGDKVPEALKAFQPAVVTRISGTTVEGISGTSENNQVCDDCIVEIFLEDTDTITEALRSLDVVVADADGRWTATLPAPLGADQRVRTMSTVPDRWTIDDLDAGTTSNLSILYPAYQVFLPLVVRGF